MAPGERFRDKPLVYPIIFKKTLDKSRKAYEQAQVWAKLDEATIAQLQAAVVAAKFKLGHHLLISIS